MLESVCNYLGQSFALWPTAETKTLRDIDDPTLEKEVSSFLTQHWRALLRYSKEGFIINSNEEILGLIVRRNRFKLAEAFYKANPGINANAPELKGNINSFSIITSLIISIHVFCPSDVMYEGESRQQIREFIKLIFKGEIVDILKIEKNLDYRTLDLLLHTNDIDLLNVYMENLLDRVNVEDITLARRIFVEIRKSYKIGCVLKVDSELWKNYLSLLKAKYPDAFSDLDCESNSIKSTVDALSAIAERFSIPQELYEDIALRNFLEEEPLLRGLPEDLLKSVVKIPQEKILIQKLIKLSTLSFQDFQKKSGRKLNNDQKKLCYKLIKEAFFKTARPFDAEIKQKIVFEISQIEVFSETKIRKAIKKAFK